MVLVVLTQGDGRHEEDFMGEDSAGLVGLGPTHSDSIGMALHNAEEHVIIYLLAGTPAAVAFDVGGNLDPSMTTALDGLTTARWSTTATALLATRRTRTATARTASCTGLATPTGCAILRR
jgi:hypothetical protein